MTSLTGVDMTGDDLGAGSGVPLGGSNTPKYYQMDYDKDYFVRLVTGYMPYLSYYRTTGPSLISPSTLTLTQKFQTPNGVVEQRIYKKEDGNDYSADECRCPMMDQGNTPQTRYGTNIVDWQEVQSNPNGPHTIYILSGGKQVFKHFLLFKNAMRDYPAFDPDRGPIWRIRKMKEGQRTNYLVEPMQEAPLPPSLRAQIGQVKEKPGDPGVWKLKDEFHPFYCSEKQAIDNGYNPIFKKIAQEQSAQKSYGVEMPVNGPGPIPTSQPLQQVNPNFVPQPQVVQAQAPQQQQVAPQPVYQQQGPVVQTVQPAFEQVAGVTPLSAISTQAQVAPVFDSTPPDQNFWESKLTGFDED